MLERTLVLMKPSALQRRLVGKMITGFESKGLHIVGMKMMQLDDAILDEHYAHLKERPFFKSVKKSMMATPVIAMCLEGVEAVEVVREIAGPTNGRTARLDTLRGMYCMSSQENLIHTSDCLETAKVEVARFFTEEELFEWTQATSQFLYAADELD